MALVRLSVLAFTIVLALGGAVRSDGTQAGNLGYNSFEGYMSQGAGLNRYFGSGPGYPTDAGGDYFHRYIAPEDWGKYGYGTGHLGQGYGPYVFPREDAPPPRGLYDPLPQPLREMRPPSIKIKHGQIRVALPSNIPGVCCVTVTVLAFNGAELATQSLQGPPFEFVFPVMDGCKNVRVRMEYVDNGLSATAYPL